MVPLPRISGRKVRADRYRGGPVGPVFFGGSEDSVNRSHSVSTAAFEQNKSGGLFGEP